MTDTLVMGEPSDGAGDRERQEDRFHGTELEQLAKA